MSLSLTDLRSIGGNAVTLEPKPSVASQIGARIGARGRAAEKARAAAVPAPRATAPTRLPAMPASAASPVPLPAEPAVPRSAAGLLPTAALPAAGLFAAFSVPALVAAATLAPVAAAFGGALLAGTGKAAVGAALAIAGALGLLAFTRPLVRRAARPDSVMLSRRQRLLLFDMVDRLAKAMKVARPVAIAITPDPAVALVPVPTLRATGLGGRLDIGHALLAALSPRDLEALIARALAASAGGLGPGGRFQRALDLGSGVIASAGSAPGPRLIARLVAAQLPTAARVGAPALREATLRADRLAAEVVGPHALGQALVAATLLEAGRLTDHLPGPDDVALVTSTPPAEGVILPTLAERLQMLGVRAEVPRLPGSREAAATALLGAELEAVNRFFDGDRVGETLNDMLPHGGVSERDARAPDPRGDHAVALLTLARARLAGGDVSAIPDLFEVAELAPPAIPAVAEAIERFIDGPGADLGLEDLKPELETLIWLHRRAIAERGEVGPSDTFGPPALDLSTLERAGANLGDVAGVAEVHLAAKDVKYFPAWRCHVALVTPKKGVFGANRARESADHIAARIAERLGIGGECLVVTPDDLADKAIAGAIRKAGTVLKMG